MAGEWGSVTLVTPVLVGVAGGTGSGQDHRGHQAGSPPCRRISASLDSARLVLPGSQPPRRAAARARVNPGRAGRASRTSLLRGSRGLQGGQGSPLARSTTSRRTCAGASACRSAARPIVVVEGILLFAVLALREVFDLRLFVDTDDDVRLLRRIRRDPSASAVAISPPSRRSTPRSVRLDGIAQHVAPSRAHAHLVIPEGGENDTALDVVVGRLLHLLGAKRGV